MPALHPDRYLYVVSQIEPSELVAQGIRYLLLDIDNTIVARGTSTIDPAAVAWISALQQQDIRICLLSNNWHRVVLGYAEELNLPIVYRAVKPLPAAFLKAKRLIGARARQTLVVGDQIVTDIFGGKFLGMHTVLVRPLAERDLWHTLLLRRLECLILGDMQPENKGQVLEPLAKQGTEPAE